MQRRILPILSVVVLVGVMGLFSVHTLTSIYQDIGRHIRLGEIIWTTHEVPRTNVFSYTAQSFPFINHHWLSEVLIYLGDRVVGLPWLIALKASLVALAFGLSLAAAWRSRLALSAMGVGLVSIFIMIERTDVRPEILSFVFLGWYLFVLYRHPHSRLVWELPFVQLLWVNSHIYFFMGPLVFMAWWIGEVVQSGRSALLGRRHWLLAILIAVATLMNPWGWDGAFYPLHILGNYGYSIVENQSPFFLQDFGYPQLTSIAVYLGIALIVLSFLVNARRIRHNAFGLIIGITTAIFSLMMVRNFPLFALVMMPVILKNLDEAHWHWESRQITLIGLIVLLLLGVSIATNQIYADAGLGRQFGIHVPVGYQQPIDFFRQAKLKGPIFNNFDVGSFLIWKLPEEQVFIDGRPEAYPVDFIQNIYIKMQEDPAIWHRYSEQYKINTIFWNEQDITPWSRAFVARITQDTNWKIVYRDQGIVILTKRGARTE